jgi:recombination protein RecT
MAFFRLNNGFSKSLYMTAGEVEKHAKRYSQTYASKNDYVRNSSKWTTDFDAMARKTVLKLLLSRFAPLSVDMQQAVQADQAVMRSDNNFDYVDNEKEEPKSTLDLAREAMQHAEEVEAVDTETGEILSQPDTEQPQQAEAETPSKENVSTSDTKKKSTKQHNLFEEDKQ